MQARRNLAVLECQRRLDQAGDTGGRFEVAQIGLCRSDGAKLPRRAFEAQHRAQRLCFDRISQQRACPMRFDVLNRARRDVGLPVCRTQHGLLGKRVRRHQAIASSVLIHGATANDRMDRIAIGQRLREPFQHDDAGALAANISVGAGIERFAASVRGHSAGLGEIDRDCRRENDVDASGQGQRAFAAAQAAASEVNGDEGGRAGGIDGDARPVKIEHVRNAIGGNAERIARAGIGIDLAEIIPPQAAIVVGRDADEDPGLGAGQPLRHLPRVLQRLPGYLQQKPLLGIHARRLARRNAEKARIEPIHLPKKPAPPRVHLPRRGRVRIEERLRVEPVGRNLTDCIDSVSQHAPKCGRILRAREAAAHADDGDRFVVRVRFAVGGSECRFARRPRQISGERLDRGVFVNERRRKLALQPLGKFASQAHGVRRSEAIVGKILPHVDFVRGNSQPLGKFGDQPGANFVGFGRQIRHESSRRTHDFQRALEVADLACMSLHLAAGGLGNATRPEQNHAYRPAHRAAPLPPAGSSEPPPEHPGANVRWDGPAIPHRASEARKGGSETPLPRQ